MTATMHKCASPKCPGYPFRASDLSHPANTCGPQAEDGAPGELVAAKARELEAEAAVPRAAGNGHDAPEVTAEVERPSCERCALYEERVRELEAKLRSVREIAGGTDA